MAAPVLQFKRGLIANLPALKAGEPGFTTDNYDFYIGLDNNSANNKFFGSHRYWTKETSSEGSGINLVEGTSNGSDYITLSAPSSVGAAVTFIFPGVQGFANSVLTNDGNGNLSWSSGSSDPVFSGIVTFNSTQVHINSTLDVSGITTFTDTTDNTLSDPDTGAVQIDGGLGVNKNVTIGDQLYVEDAATFNGSITCNNSIIPSVGDSDGNGIEWTPNPGGGSGDKAYIRYYVESGENTRLIISNQNDSDDDIYLDTPIVNVSNDLNVGGATTLTGNLYVGGQSEFIGIVTFRGGTINLGDSGGDDVVVGGEFASDLIPTTDDTYSLGSSSKQWKDLYVNGTADLDAVTISGITTISNTTNSTSPNSGALIIEGGVGIAKTVHIGGDLDVTGNVTIGGTFVSLKGQDVFIENKDLILGYTTTTSPNDDTANHAGVAIASTEGSPLVSFTATGINTLPDTYKQLMWFKNGTLGFSTDAFAFNYALAVGTDTMADGVRLAVGSGVTVSDTAVSASTFYGTLVGNVSGNITSADQVKTVTASNNNSNYYVTFVDSHNGSATNESVYTDDGIYYNPGTNTFTTQYGVFTGDVTVNGTITGTATTATRSTTVDTTATSTNSTYYVPFVDTFAGQNGETIRVGAGLSLNPSDGSVATGGILSVGSPTALTSYIKAGGGSNAMYLYGNGDVSFQSKIIASQIRSNDSATTLITLSGLDATFARNVSISGITTVTGQFVTGTNATIGGDITVGGNDIKASDGTTAITLSPTTGNVGVSSNLTVTGNLYVLGSTTEVNTETLKVEDSLIEVGLINSGGSLVPPTSDLNIDVGVIFHYYTSTAKKAGVYWDDSASRVVVSSDLSETSSVITSSAYAALEVGSLWVTDCAGTSQVISCTGSERFLENITVDGGVF